MTYIKSLVNVASRDSSSVMLMLIKDGVPAKAFWTRVRCLDFEYSENARWFQSKNQPAKIAPPHRITFNALLNLVMLRYGKTRSQPGFNNASRDAKVGSTSCLKIRKTNPISASVGSCHEIYLLSQKSFTVIGTASRTVTSPAEKRFPHRRWWLRENSFKKLSNVLDMNVGKYLRCSILSD